MENELESCDPGSGYRQHVNSADAALITSKVSIRNFVAIYANTRLSASHSVPRVSVGFLSHFSDHPAFHDQRNNATGRVCRLL